MTRLVEAVRALVGTNEHREAMGKHVRLLDALRDALVEHDGLRPAEASSVPRIYEQCGGGKCTLQDCPFCEKGKYVGFWAGVERVKAQCTCAKAREMGADLELGCPVHDPNAIENARRQRIVDDRRRLEAQRAAERLAQPLGRCCISGRCDGEGCPCACHPGNPDRPDDADSRGRSEATPSELFPLAVRIEKGRQKYPNGCTLLSLLDEAGEIAHAVNKYEVEERVRDELLDVAAVAMRLYLGEIDRGLEIDGLVQRRTDTPAAGSLDAIYEPFTDEHTGETLYRCRAAATPQCCYEAPAGIHSENCPTRADEAPPPCRRCSECRGENHHWIEECEEPTPEKPDGWAGYVCRHCEARAEMCISCDGAAEPGHVCTDEEDA